LRLGGNSFAGGLPPEWSGLRAATEEADALLALKEQRQRFSGALSDWSPARPKCEWSGVTCSGSSGEVVGLYLNSNSLSGTLPPRWSALTGLEWMSLGSNALSGALPPQWSALTGLEEMWLSSNALRGALPPQWSALTRLKRMRLTNNSLSGALPPQWSALTGMWRMYLSSNSLSGALPPQWSALAGLGRMNLGGNGFSGALPPEWSGLRFALDGELVLAAFPPPYAVQEAFGGYDETGKLIEFDLNNKSVSLRPPGSSVCVSEAVSFPEGLEGTELKLSYGDSREVTFGGGFSFPFFGTVYSSVHIGSYGCLTFGGSDNLTSVSGGGFDSLSGLLRAHNALPRVSAAFTDLDPEDGGSVTYRQLRGRFVVTFSDVPARTYYGSPAGVLSFQIVLHGDGEVTVTYLRVRGFSGSHFMAGVSSGSAADAFSMDLSAVPCAAYGEAEALMALKDQQRSGVLPDWSAARPSCGWSGVKCSASGEVLELDLSREGLTGTLPPRWSELKSITDMDMHGNRLAGTLPPQWSELTVIADMDLGFNILSGTLPPQWSTLSSLKRMRMEENSLTGALPPQWSTLSDIDRMHLSGNDFTGTLPPEWSTINSALDNVFPATTAANPSDSSGEDIWRWTGGLAVTVALAILIL